MKNFFKKLLAFSLIIVFVIPCMQLIGCGADVTLVVYNCQDYIDETLIDEFEKEYKEKYGKTLEVVYDTFDTLENMYANVKINPDTYDLICPSDYMIEKMAREGLLQKLDFTENSDYVKNVSPYIDNKLKSLTLSNGENVGDYAAGYMWGTIGMAYNPEKVNGEDLSTWNILWTNKYKKKFSIKNSVRDTYFVGLAKTFNTQLNDAKFLYESNSDLTSYQATLTQIFNDTTANTVNKVKNDLISLKRNAFTMEVDEGKDLLIKGDIDIYVAWSGDAVYALDCAEEEVEKEFNYVVPNDGSNVWFDGWCLLKTSTKKDIAMEFINFLSRPENVIKNMEYIGYVSCIGGEDIFDWVVDTYGSEEGEYSVDLSYFFGDGDYTVQFDELDRQFSAQYPDKSVIDRCVGMNYYPDDANERVNMMWQDVVATD